MARYKPAFSLWKHQREGQKKMAYEESFALHMAMRTGKSPLTLADFGQLELDGLVQDLFGFAPAGAYRTWEDDVLPKHLSTDLKKRLRVHTWSAADGVKRTNVLDSFMADQRRPRALFVNTEALSSVKRARDLVKAFLDQRSAYSFCDEATDIKNPDSERAKFAVDEVRPRSNYRRVLTGLPTPKSPLDIWMQMEFLDTNILGFRSFLGFEARYAKVVELPIGPVIVNRYDGQPLLDAEGRPRRRMIKRLQGFVDVEDIHEKIAPHSHRVRLEDCYDLPPKMYFFRDVEMTSVQKRVYEEMKMFATAELEDMDHVTAHHVVVQMLRLHQILCGHVRTEDGRLVEVPENRSDAICDFLQEHDGKAIIWCAYDYNVQQMVAKLEKKFGRKVARFWGGNRNTREAEEKMFLNDPNCTALVATAAAGGRGRTWTVADTVIYHSCTNNLEHRMQSEERAQAMEKHRNVGYYDFRCRGTVEDPIYAALRKKLNLASIVTGDDYKRWII